jgi:hypothetical protein
MGDEVSAHAITTSSRRAYREKLAVCLQALARMLEEHPSAAPGSACRFDDAPPSAGLEIELDLVDAALDPLMANDAALALVDDPDFQAEIGRWTIELNVPPTSLAGQGLPALEERLRASLDRAHARAAGAAGAGAGAGLVMVGVLPTLFPEQLTGDWRTESVRYRYLDEAILAARGEDADVLIEGVETLATTASSIAFEAACTSTQLHRKVTPEGFAPTWNASQLLLGPQVALGANSPFFAGRRLWDETRIELFAQSVDTRPVELRRQGVRERAYFGEGWAGSVHDLFAENVAYFPALLPELSEEDPLGELDAGRVPRLQELRLHGGTVWRWNRPIYDVALTAAGQGAGEGAREAAHLRVENRVLPAGPTVVDTLANAALYYGALRVLVEDGPDPRTSADFEVVRADFAACARTGLTAEVTWPGLGRLPVRSLLLEHLLPMAAEGLAREGVPAAVVDRYLGVAQARASAGVTGAVWQTRAVAALEAGGADRVGALHGMLARYVEGMHANAPVHTWALP